mgnify:CR=1 FL=1
MNIFIRQATIKDVPTLLAINLSSFNANATYDSHIDMNWVHTDHAKNHFVKAVSELGHYTIIAEVEDKVVGFLMLGPKHLVHRKVKMIELDILAILPKFRSKGIGAKLMDHAKRWAREQGYETMYASSYIKNDRAVDFYKKQGFATIDISLEMEL